MTSDRITRILLLCGLTLVLGPRGIAQQTQPLSTAQGSALVQKNIDLDMKACLQDNKSDACIQAGDLYAKYANDQVAANLLYRKACNLDNATGCNKVAVLYENGIGIPRNNATAADYYSRACKLANKPACAKAQALAPK